MSKRILVALVVILAAALAPAAMAQERRYEIGGPLAGERIPLFQTQFGEQPGFPGSIPELIAQGEAVRDMGNEYQEWGTQGMAPEWQLYPNALEHWRAYWFKYCPVRSIFDQQSQIKNWTAPAIPGATAADAAKYASPVYWVPRHTPVRDTGRKLPPADVVRLKVKAPVLKLALGELPVSLYAVRVIAAVPTDQLRPFRKSIFLRFKVNDGNNGETTEYKRRIGYCDEFYSVCEFYFNAPAQRAYTAELWMDEGSELDLLVRNVTLDDVLAGSTRQALKQKVVMAAERKAEPRPSKYTPEDRLARDAAIWNYLPPLNHQGAGNTWRQASFTAIYPPEVTFGTADKDRKQLGDEFGVWGHPFANFAQKPFPDDRANWETFLVNPKMDLKYSIDDMIHYRALPDPYPIKDDGMGVTYVDAAAPDKGRMFAEVGIEVMNRIREYPEIARYGAVRWRSTGDSDAARDGAMAMARYAYIFPSIESATYFCNLVRDPGGYGRNMFDRRREAEAMFLTHYAQYLQAPMSYDALFDYIQGNEELAQSIGRFIPWVKSSQDVVKLLDVYLVQMTAKRIMRYHYHTNPTAIAELAGILGQNETTTPWLDWLFARSFIYPLPVAGVQDLMITGDDREGAQYIGSTYYAQGEGASGMAESIEKFVQMGVLPKKYDLTDAALYPKPLAKCHWQLNIMLGGLDFPRIGDVGGPDKAPGMTMSNVLKVSQLGWRWSSDPRFAWVIKTMGKKAEYAPEEWARIEQAAAGVPRAPWLDNRSRQVYNWIGALETGLETSDPMLRRAAYLRTGAGIGHAHADALDLQYYILGLPMTVDGGQRPGYASPGDGIRRVHNAVELEGAGNSFNSWVSALADAEGARYLRATAAPPKGATLYNRAIALVDVQTTPATSYVFDVSRVAGGTAHTYNFHGPVTDEVTTNAVGMQPVAKPAEGQDPTPEQAWLKPFSRSGETWVAGKAPEILETTWRYSRGAGPGVEMRMLGNKFSAQSPRKYTRLHLFDVPGDSVMRADSVCYQWKYNLHCQGVRRGGEAGLQSAYVALHEPYSEAPFIAERAWVTIPGNETDALKAVAVEVRTTTGQTDLLFSDGRPEKTRSVRDAQIAGEFACLSADKDGLLSAVLAGGALLKGPQVELTAAARAYAGKVTAVDYLQKQMTIDAAWPAVAGGNVFEVGTPERTTSYTSVTVEPKAGGSLIQLDRGADYFRAQALSVDEKTGMVKAQLEPSLGQMPGLDKGFVASNDARTKFWRADVLADGLFQLKGGPVSMADFAPEGALRLWEYGVGDSVAQSTHVALRRVEPGVYLLQTNVACTVALPATAIEASADRQAWRPLTFTPAGKLARVAIAVTDLPKDGKLYLRVK